MLTHHNCGAHACCCPQFLALRRCYILDYHTDIYYRRYSTTLNIILMLFIHPKEDMAYAGSTLHPKSTISCMPHVRIALAGEASASSYCSKLFFELEDIHTVYTYSRQGYKSVNNTTENARKEVCCEESDCGMAQARSTHTMSKFRLMPKTVTVTHADCGDLLVDDARAAIAEMRYRARPPPLLW